MLDRKYLPSDAAVLSRIGAILEEKRERLLREIDAAGGRNVVIAGLPGSGRTRFMQLLAERFQGITCRDLDSLPILAQIAGFDSPAADHQNRYVVKTRLSAQSFTYFFPFSDDFLVDDTKLWLDENDIVDIFPAAKYSSQFRSALFDRFGGWVAGVSAVAARVSAGSKPSKQTIDDAVDDVALRYFAKFTYDLPDALIDDLLLCIAARGCTRESLALAGYPIASETFERFLLVGLADHSGHDDRIAVPLPVIVASQRERRRMMTVGTDLADRLWRCGDTISSVTVLQNIGSTLAAVSALEHEANFPNVVLVNDLAERQGLRLDGTLVSNIPIFWLGLFLYRSQLVASDQLFDEAETLLQMQAHLNGHPGSMRELVLLARDIRLSECREPQLSEQEIEKIVHRWASTPFGVMAAMIAGEHCAINGLFVEAQANFALAQSRANYDANVVTYSNSRLLRLARRDDDLEHEEKLAHSVFDLTRYATSPSSLYLSYFEISISAWLLGDEDLFDTCLTKISRIDDAPCFAPYREFVRAARGFGYDASAGTAYMNAWMALIDALSRHREQADSSLLKRAYDFSRVSGYRFLEGIAGMAYARALTGEQRVNLLRATVLVAEEMGHETLRRRANALIDDDSLESEMHVGWLRRYQSEISLTPMCEPRLSILTGFATVDGEGVHLSEKIRMLFTLLVLAPRVTSPEELMTAIWPDASAESARNALKMCVRRARKMMRSETIIERTASGYRLDPAVKNDVRDIEAWLASDALVEDPIGAMEFVSEALLGLLQGLPAEIPRYDVYDDLRAVLVNLEHDVKSRLTELFSKFATPTRCRTIVRQMAQYDVDLAEELLAVIDRHTTEDTIASH